MRKFSIVLTYSIAALLGLLFFIPESNAQEAEPVSDTIPADLPAVQDFSVQDSFPPEGELQLRIGDNLDSLLNLWYVNRSLETATDDYLAEADTLFPDFSDSVYMHRLAEIPSVVDLTYNRIVKNYINVYSRNRREQVRNMLGLADYYFPIYEEIFDLYGVPYEIKYLSVIESALNPRAVSRAGAVGTWQFMYGTGKQYGLTINSLVDERRDPIEATHAAARFLADLYDIYHDWTLALAAYNCGPGNVNKAIRRSGGKRLVNIKGFPGLKRNMSESSWFTCQMFWIDIHNTPTSVHCKTSLLPG